MAKRISKSSIDWLLLTENFRNQDKQIATSLKILSDKYLRELESKPAELPKIDWNLYKSKITAPGMVDLFQKNYETLKIPYPSDQGLLAETEQRNKNLISYAEKRDAEIKETIKKLEEKVKKLAAEMRYVDMTMEEFYLARPDLKVDPDKPEYWPHLYHRSLKKEKNLPKEDKQ